MWPRGRASVGPPMVLTQTLGAAQVVARACRQARQRGLKLGMSLGQAQALVPELVVLPHEPARDRAALLRLATWAIRFSPLVEPVEPDTLLAEVTGCELLFGGEKNIVRQAAAGLARQGFRARAAIADTVGAAYALATAAPEVLTIVPTGQTSACLAPLPPSALRLDAQVSERLDALGVRSIGDLLMLPRGSLAARFGSELVLRVQQALGEVFESLDAHRPEELPAARRRFEVALADWQMIRAVAEQLLADVHGQVSRAGGALRRLECVLYFERGGPRVMSIALARASRRQQHVTQLLVQRLEQVDLTPGVIGLMLVARETSRYRGGQGDLFEPREPGDDEALGCLIDRVAGRVGHAAIVRPRLLDDHQPEKAFRYVPVAEAGCEAVEREADRSAPGKGADRLSVVHGEASGGDVPGGKGCGSEASGGEVPGGETFGNDAFGGDVSDDGLDLRVTSQRREKNSPGLPQWGDVLGQLAGGLRAAARPARLLPRPIPIRVIALLPDGPPTWFAWGGREYVVADTAGPERLETAWWRGRDVRRDYFRVTAESGEQFWVFRAADEGRWYLHGMFG